MNDRFKFRAVIRKFGKIYFAYSDYDKENPDSFDFKLCFENGEFVVYEYDWVEYEYSDELEWVRQYPNDSIQFVAVEQCTGLKDKNGKLIYEGDIVKKEFKDKPFSSKAKTKEKLIKIKWNDVEACFSFDFLNEKDKHDDFQCWECGWRHKYSNDEVIGNIHENPELLEMQDA